MRVTVAPLALASLVILLGCTPADRFASDQTPLSPAPRSGSVDPTAPAQPSPEPYASPPPHPHPVSLPALIAKDLRGGDLAVGRVTLRTDAYTQHAVTYRSGGLTVSGLMNVPRGDGPWPALVLAHGYIDPQVYVSGQGLTRERDYLARHGFLTLHVDYRNHAGSSSDPTADRRLRLGYTEDVINAVHALRAGPSYVDDDRIGLLGRSMGGGVIYNVLVVAPGLVDAAAVFAPVSSDTVDNFERWIRRNPSRNGLAQQILTLLRRAIGTTRVLASRQPSNVLRSGHRTRAHPPRHPRPELPHQLEPDDGRSAGAVRQGRAPVRVPGRRARIRSAVAVVHETHRGLLRRAPGLNRPCGRSLLARADGVGGDPRDEQPFPRLSGRALAPRVDLLREAAPAASSTQQGRPAHSSSSRGCAAGTSPRRRAISGPRPSRIVVPIPPAATATACHRIRRVSAGMRGLRLSAQRSPTAGSAGPPGRPPAG